MSPNSTFTPSAPLIERRVEKAKDRWKTSLDEADKRHFPRETDRTYNVTNFLQQSSAHHTIEIDAQRSTTSTTTTYETDAHHVPDSAASPQPQKLPCTQSLISPLSPSVYSRNTDGLSILPNDSVMSFDGTKVDRDHDGGSAVILTSQSVRSYVIGTPSPRRPESTRTSRDWKAWLSHEVSGMELDSHEDLTIHERYTNPVSSNREDEEVASHIEQDGDTTVILRDTLTITTPRAASEHRSCIDASMSETRLDAPKKVHNSEPACDHTVAPVSDGCKSNPEMFKEVSPIHSPDSLTGATAPGTTILRQGSTPTLIRPHLCSIPSRHSFGSQPALVTPTSSRMNERFPFINTGRRSSSNSARSSRQSKSPTDSLASLTSMKSASSPNVYSDLSAPATSQTRQRVSDTTLKRRDALHKRKENVTPPTIHANRTSHITPTDISKSLQPLSSSLLNQKPSNDCQHVPTIRAVKHGKHESIPVEPCSRAHVRAVLRPISLDRQARRPQSAFDLRSSKSQQASHEVDGNIGTNEVIALRPTSGNRLPVLHFSSSNALHSNSGVTAGFEIRNREDEHRGVVSPGQRMASQFLRQRKSIPALEHGRLRGGMRLVREDTPAFL